MNKMIVHIFRRRPVFAGIFRRNTPGLLSAVLAALSVFLTAGTVPAQEALQNSIATQNASAGHAQQMQNPDYTFKAGDFRLLVTPAFSGSWNDNVNLTKTNRQDDFILTPSVGLMSSYPLTQRNVLFVNVDIGYSRYLKEPNLSTFNINSSTGNGISLDVGVKDVTLNFHDWFSLTQDASQTPTVANTGTYGTFQNTAGLLATWDLNQVNLAAGYDHQNVLSTSAGFDNINHYAELFDLRGGLRVHPEVTVGLETTAALTTYDQNTLNNNNDAYTAGAYAQFQPSETFHITARGGFATYQFQETSDSLRTTSQNSWYAGLDISQQLRESVSYTLSAGHEVQLGTQSDLTEDWYVRPVITWKIIKGWEFSTSFSYEHGQQGVGSTQIGTLPNNNNNVLGETFNWFNTGLDLSHAVTDRIDMSVYYRATIRSSNMADNEYTQNMVGIRLTYHPK